MDIIFEIMFLLFEISRYKNLAVDENFSSFRHREDMRIKFCYRWDFIGSRSIQVFYTISFIANHPKCVLQFNRSAFKILLLHLGMCWWYHSKNIAKAKKCGSSCRYKHSLRSNTVAINITKMGGWQTKHIKPCMDLLLPTCSRCVANCLTFAI